MRLDINISGSAEEINDVIKNIIAYAESSNVSNVNVNVATNGNDNQEDVAEKVVSQHLDRQERKAWNGEVKDLRIYNVDDYRIAFLLNFMRDAYARGVGTNLGAIVRNSVIKEFIGLCEELHIITEEAAKKLKDPSYEVEYDYRRRCATLTDILKEYAIFNYKFSYYRKSQVDWPMWLIVRE